MAGVPASMTSRCESSTSRRFLGTILSGRVLAGPQVLSPLTWPSARVLHAPAADNSPMTIEHVQEVLPRNMQARAAAPSPSFLSGLCGSRSWPPGRMDVHGLAALRLAARGSTKVVVRQSGSRHAGKEIIKPKLGGHAPKLGYSAVLAAYAARNRVDTEHAFSIELRRMNNAGDRIGSVPGDPRNLGRQWTVGRPEPARLYVRVHR